MISGDCGHIIIKPSFRFPTKFNLHMYTKHAPSKYAGAMHHDQCIVHVSAYTCKYTTVFPMSPSLFNANYTAH